MKPNPAQAGATQGVIGLRKTQDRWTTNYHVKVAPLSASAEPVELDVSRETYQSLREGAAVRISVRAGALDISWVEKVHASGAIPTARAPCLNKSARVA